MGKHSKTKFQCENCDPLTGLCSNRTFHLSIYRKHYYIFKKAQNQSELPDIVITKKKILISMD